MYLRVIEGGLAESGTKAERPLSKTDVLAEAMRRIRASGYDRYHARYLVTGEPVPKRLQYLKIQIAWVADTLSGLDPIPPDYAEDKYWPA